MGCGWSRFKGEHCSSNHGCTCARQGRVAGAGAGIKDKGKQRAQASVRGGAGKQQRRSTGEPAAHEEVMQGVLESPPQADGHRQCCHCYWLLHAHLEWTGPSPGSSLQSRISGMPPPHTSRLTHITCAQVHAHARRRAHTHTLNTHTHTPHTRRWW